MDQNNLFRFAVDNAVGMIVVFDDSGMILYANRVAADKLEYYDELCQKPITEIFPADFEICNGKLVDSDKIDGSFRSVMAYRKNRTCFPVSAKFLIHNGVEQIQTVPEKKCDELIGDEGYRTYVCTAYDMSKEEFLEKKVNSADKEVEAALKVKSEFMANVTHELRTPVNGILGNTLELLNREADKDKIKLLEMIERGCRDMNSIINNVLDFSKLEAGKFTLEAREFDFHKMIEYVEGSHRPRFTEKGLDFSIGVSPEIPERIIGDELRIVQVLNNLISNAYKFTSVGGVHVEIVMTARAGSRIELFFMVIDSGIGIAKADQDKLFKSFSQVDASISRKYGGTGLGLNISKQLVELMNGDIHVESTVGKGTTFSFQIWVELPETELANGIQGSAGDIQPGMFTEAYQAEQDKKSLLEKMHGMSESRVDEAIWQFGTEENRKELEKKMSKLILSLEMENWEKAEMFAETVKQLVEGAPREVKSAALRLKMAVQKGDYEKAVSAYELLQQNL
ncbi:MAG: hypothetical protein E7299_02800 [Lachnospiraceae bacterium]|nr:hypothetical protein [Lachnospiraceae bacterium]